MKTRFSRIVTSFALLFAVLAGNITTVFADNGDIATYGMVCVCGNGTYQEIDRKTTAWTDNGTYVTCTHHAHGLDHVQTQKVIITYRCNYCGRGRSTTNTNTRKVCHGYDY